jgi:NADH-quinone oxidoreductase subunit E
MAVRRLHHEQPHGFAFSAENLAWAKETIAKYPPGKQASAVIPLLWRAQEQCGGWLPEPALRVVADMLGMAHIRAYEIATFYTMFQLSPVGTTAHVQVCGTTPCMLRGSGALIDVCKRRIAEKILDGFAQGNPPKPGSQTGRQTSAPVGGPTTLRDPSLYDGSALGAWKARFPELEGKG